MDFDQAFDVLMKHEGIFSDHPSDPGGKTCWGVTEAVARRFGYAGRMQDMPKDTAKEIAHHLYWDEIKADSLPPIIRYAVFDAAYNSGPAQSIKWLQAALGLQQDGVIGPVTLAAVRVPHGYELRCKLIALRLEFLTRLKIWPAFSAGWSRRLASILMM